MKVVKHYLSYFLLNMRYIFIPRRQNACMELCVSYGTSLFLLPKNFTLTSPIINEKTMLHNLAKKYWDFRAFNVINMLFRWKYTSLFS